MIDFSSIHIALIANHNPTSISSYVYLNLLRLGCKVSFFSSDIPAHDGVIKCSPNPFIPDLIAQLDKTPDLILFVESSIHPLIVPSGLEHIKIPTAWWAIDNHMNYRWHKEYASFFNHSFFAMHDYIPLAENYSGKKIHWLPLCADEKIHNNKNLERTIECGFVGNVNKSRQAFFNMLNAKQNVSVFSGKNRDEMAEIYNRSKTVINICVREDLNMRVFEAMACGALLITPKIKNGQDLLFQEYKHLILHNYTNAHDVIKNILKAPDTLSEIAKCGQSEVLNKHTYQHRIKAIINTTLGSSGNCESTGWRSDMRKYFVYNHKHFSRKAIAYQSLKNAYKNNPILSFIYMIKWGIEYLKQKIYLSKLKRVE